MPHIIKDEHLSLRYKVVSEIANRTGNQVSEMLSNMIETQFQKDERFEYLNCSQAMSYIQKISQIIFLRLLNITIQVARHFPDVEHNEEELFNECVEGMRYLAGFKKIDEKEYINGIKRIRI